MFCLDHKGHCHIFQGTDPVEDTFSDNNVT